MNPDDVVVRLQGAAVRAGGRTLWSGVDLTVRAGEFVAVLGPNGVGKSTLVKALLGTVPLSAGSAEVLGAPPGEAGDRIGYLPQRRSFDPDLWVRGVDVVRLGLDGARWGVPLPGQTLWSARARAERDRVREVIARVGAQAYADRPVGQLSGGEQQRLLIAQALASRPRLLLLDEPLDSLDLPNPSAVAGLVAELWHRAGVAAGTPAEVVTGDTLTRLYGTPVEVLTTSDGRLVVVGQPEAPAYHSDRHAHEH